MKKITCITLIGALAITAGGFAYLSTDKKENTSTKAIYAQAANNETESTKEIPSRKAEYKKDENIYGILNLDGSLSEMYVVNQFEVEKSGIIEDFGDYDVITNLTNTDEISSKNNTQKFKADKGYFYYQGTQVKSEIPWQFSINYFLDDKEISAKDLAGNSGKFKVKIKIKKNTEAKKDFYENFMLQVALTLDNDKASAIKAPSAQIADAGTAKQINFTCLPGKNASYTLTADVKDFEMSGISIAAVPFSSGMELPDTDSMTKGLTKLSDGILKLDDGAGKLSEGAASLEDGITQYTDGVSSFNAGLQTINDNYSKISSGGKKISKGSKEISNGLSKLGKGGTDISKGSEEINKTLLSLKEKLSHMDLSGLNPQDKAVLLGMISGLADNYGEFNSGLASFSAGVSEISKGYDSFNSGLNEYTSGVSKMGAGINKLANGSQKISDGGKELSEGANNYSDGMKKYKDGTKKFADGVSNMPEKMNKKIDEMMDDYIKDFDPISFTSDKNTNINAVQFTLKTPDIKVAEKKEDVKEEKEESVLDRLANLFK